MPEDTTVINSRFGGVDCLRLDVGGRGRAAIYFHGGGYVYTRAADALGAIATVAKRCRLQMVAPDYRRAPEFPFPAAIDDAVAVYRALLDDGVPNTDIVFAGDSAGGGLALACMLASRRSGLPPPAAGISSRRGPIWPLRDRRLSSPMTRWWTVRDCGRWPTPIWTAAM